MVFGSLLGRGDCICWLRAVSLFGRGGLWLYCLIGGCKVERGVWYSYSGLEILHGGEGGDVELGARTSKHILEFAFNPLVSFTLSLFYFVQSIFNQYISYHLYCLHLCLAYLHIAYSYYLLGCVCASLILNQQELHIAPQPILRGIKRS